MAYAGKKSGPCSKFMALIVVDGGGGLLFRAKVAFGGAGYPSVFRWQQDRRGTPVGLGDDPNLLAGPQCVGRQHTQAVLQGVLVRLPVAFANFAVVTTGVSGEVNVHVFIEGSRKCYESPHRAIYLSQWQRHYFFAAFRELRGFRSVSATGTSAGA